MSQILECKVCGAEEYVGDDVASVICADCTLQLVWDVGFDDVIQDNPTIVVEDEDYDDGYDDHQDR